MAKPKKAKVETSLRVSRSCHDMIVALALYEQRQMLDVVERLANAEVARLRALGVKLHQPRTPRVKRAPASRASEPSPAGPVDPAPPE